MPGCSFIACTVQPGLSNVRRAARIKSFDVDCRGVNDPRCVLVDFTSHPRDGFACCHAGINGSGSLIVVPDYKRIDRYMGWRGRCCCGSRFSRCFTVWSGSGFHVLASHVHARLTELVSLSTGLRTVQAMELSRTIRRCDVRRVRLRSAGRSLTGRGIAWASSTD
jgi:hypothetical protein